jgi:hypothetical protein
MRRYYLYILISLMLSLETVINMSMVQQTTTHA